MKNYLYSKEFAIDRVNKTADIFGLPEYLCGIDLDSDNNPILRYEVPVSRYDSYDSCVYLFINTYTRRCRFEKIDQYGSNVAYYEVKNPTKEKIQEFINILTKIY